MEELLALRQHITEKRYTEALKLIAELEEMSREDKINKIYSFAVLLLLHLIKQAAEQRTTRSWDLATREATRQIARTNTRQKAGGEYLDTAGLQDVLAEAYLPVLEHAALAAFEGGYEEDELAARVNQEQIERHALELILAQQAS